MKEVSPSNNHKYSSILLYNKESINSHDNQLAKEVITNMIYKRKNMNSKPNLHRVKNYSLADQSLNSYKQINCSLFDNSKSELMRVKKQSKENLNINCFNCFHNMFDNKIVKSKEKNNNCNKVKRIELTRVNSPNKYNFKKPILSQNKSNIINKKVQINNLFLNNQSRLDIKKQSIKIKVKKTLAEFNNKNPSKKIITLSNQTSGVHTQKSAKKVLKNKNLDSTHSSKFYSININNRVNNQSTPKNVKEKLYNSITPNLNSINVNKSIMASNKKRKNLQINGDATSYVNQSTTPTCINYNGIYTVNNLNYFTNKYLNYVYNNNRFKTLNTQINSSLTYSNTLNTSTDLHYKDKSKSKTKLNCGHSNAISSNKKKCGNLLNSPKFCSNANSNNNLNRTKINFTKDAKSIYNYERLNTAFNTINNFNNGNGATNNLIRNTKFLNVKEENLLVNILKKKSMDKLYRKKVLEPSDINIQYNKENKESKENKGNKESKENKSLKNLNNDISKKKRNDKKSILFTENGNNYFTNEIMKTCPVNFAIKSTSKNRDNIFLNINNNYKKDKFKNLKINVFRDNDNKIERTFEMDIISSQNQLKESNKTESNIKVNEKNKGRNNMSNSIISNEISMTFLKIIKDTGKEKHIGLNIQINQVINMKSNKGNLFDYIINYLPNNDLFHLSLTNKKINQVCTTKLQKIIYKNIIYNKNNLNYKIVNTFLSNFISTKFQSKLKANIEYNKNLKPPATNLKSSSSSYLSEIENDINRIVNFDNTFKSNPIKSKMLHNILYAYSKYNEKIGYAQALIFIVSKIFYIFESSTKDNIEQNEIDIFLTLDFMISLLKFENVVGIKNELSDKLNIISNLLFENCFSVYTYLNKNGLSHEAFSANWIITLFSNTNCDFAYLIKIWNFIFIYGWKFIYFFIIGIIFFFREKIIRMNIYNFSMFIKEVFISEEFNRNFNEIIEVCFIFMNKKEYFFFSEYENSVLNDDIINNVSVASSEIQY